jgi:protein SCO1/2
MKKLFTMAALLLACHAWAAPVSAPLPAPLPSPLPATSLHRLDTVLTDSQSARFTLRELAGGPALVTMFYGDCGSACPIVIETLKRTVAALGPDGRRLRVLLISLDTLRDTPQQLAQLAAKQRLDAPQYRLAVAKNDADTRMIAAEPDPDLLEQVRAALARR